MEHTIPKVGYNIVRIPLILGHIPSSLVPCPRRTNEHSPDVDCSMHIVSQRKYTYVHLFPVAPVT